MKIAIIGTHGTGKTTLSYHLASYYKSIGRSVKIIQEVARSCPFPINEKMTNEAAKWIFLEHSKKELEAIKNQVVIGDRSVYDSFAYAEYFEIQDNLINRYRKLAINQLQLYDKLIFVRPDLPINDDGIRSIDQEFQISIDQVFENNLRGQDYIEIKSSEIFDEDEIWKHYCL